MTAAGRDLGLTVVVPAYEASATIAEAVASARACGAREVVVVDDGSRDGTGAIARDLGCVVVEQQNAGAAAARRTGLRRATGDLVVLLDADDVLVPDGVRRSVDLLDEGGEDVVAAGGATVYVTGGDAGAAFVSRRRHVGLTDLLADGFAPAPPAAVVWRRERLLEAAFGPLPALWPGYAEDYELLVRGTLGGRIAFHDVVCARYRTVGGKSSADPMRSILASEQIRRHYAHALGLRARPRSPWRLRSRVSLRRAAELKAAGRRGVPYVLHLADAAVRDPVLLAAMAWRTLGTRGAR